MINTWPATPGTELFSISCLFPIELMRLRYPARTYCNALPLKPGCGCNQIGKTAQLRQQCWPKLPGALCCLDSGICRTAHCVSKAHRYSSSNHAAETSWGGRQRLLRSLPGSEAGPRALRGRVICVRVRCACGLSVISKPACQAEL